MDRVDAYEWLWNYRAQELESFLDRSESGLSSELDAFSKWIDTETKGMSKDDVEAFIDHFYDDLALVRDSAPRDLRYAQYLIVFGAFEHAAGDLCRMLHGDSKVGKKPPKNIYLHDAKGYLRGQAALPATAFGSEWKFMDEARGPRNAIAHNDGQPRNDDAGKAAKKFIQKHPALSLDTQGHIDITDAFCTDLLAKARASMSELISAIKKKHY